MADLSGSEIAHYRIEALLGEGGMGEVYRARDVNLRRIVAVKVMHGYLARREQFQKRFLQEARAAANLDHPSIVKIFDFGQREDLLYMVMAFISGGSLGHYLRELKREGRVIQLQEVLYLLAQVAEALAYAHRKGVIHRDIKPDNILLKRLEEPDRPEEPPLRAVVTDFGLAKLAEGDVHTATDTFMGTLPYMSPEQALGKPLDGRSDLYSLGVILYQLATGQLPLEIRSPTEAVNKHMRETPPSPRELKPELPARVVVVIQKAIAKNPADRFRNGSELATALRMAASSLTEDDLTRYETTQTVVSLITELAGSEPPPLPSRLAPEQVEVSGDAHLFVARKGATPQQYPMKREQVTLGRSEENDIVLAAGGVSRRHARLQRAGAGWNVVDLGSTNGTYLEDVKLLPDVSEPWQPEHELRIGPFYLHWRPAEDAGTGGETRIITDSEVAAPGARLSLFPSEVAIAAGESETMQLELVNEGAEVTHYRLEVEGLPASWLLIPQNEIRLMPGEAAQLQLHLFPPKDSSARAGRHPFQLQVYAGGKQVEAQSAVLNVAPFTQFSLDVQPSYLAHGATTRITVHNEGNEETTFSLAGRDPAATVRFEGPSRLAVAPGARGEVSWRLRSEDRPVIGSSRTVPFDIRVTGPDGKAQQQQTGQLRVGPILSPLLIGILGTLLFVLCGGGALAASGLLPDLLGRLTPEAREVVVVEEDDTPLPPATVAVEPPTQAPTDVVVEPATEEPPTEEPPTEVPPTEVPDPPGPAGQIAFVSTRSGRDGLYLIDLADPGTIRQVTSPGNDERHWWPDWCGGRIYFEVGVGNDRQEIARVSPSGGNIEMITSNTFPSGSRMNGLPSCSHDGRYLAFSTLSQDAQRGNDFKLGLADLHSPGNFSLFGDGFGLGGSASWSGNNQVLVFMHDDITEPGGNFQIYRASVNDPHNFDNLTAGYGGSAKYPDWSPERDEIAFACSAGSDDDLIWSLCRVPASGGNVSVLVRDLHRGRESAGRAFHAVTPSWSPDGKWIAYASDADGDWDIYLYEVDGGRTIKLTQQWDSDEMHPSWAR